VSVAPETSSHVRVITYEVDEGARRLELVVRPAWTLRHVGVIALLVGLLGASAIAAFWASDPAGQAHLVVLAFLMGLSLFIVGTILAPRRIRVGDCVLRVRWQRYPLARVYGIEVQVPPTVPDRANVIAWVDRGSDEDVVLAVQLPLDDAHAVEEMVRAAVPLPRREGGAR